MAKYKIKKEKGQWLYSPKDDTAICSNCNYEHYLGTYHQFATNFCPNCGDPKYNKEDCNKIST